MKKSEIKMSKDLYEYILSVSLREDKVLEELREETGKDPNAIMQIPPEQGQFMALIVKMLGAKKVLEIGTYTGYSTLCFALALPKNGRVITCDLNPDWASLGQRFWQKAGVESKIDLRIGLALDSLNNLLKDGQESSFDFVFIDADKINYDRYYEKALELLRPGGIIVIDNVLLFGSVVDRSTLNADLKARISDADILAMQTLNKKIKRDVRVDVSLLPMADGLTLVRKI